MADEMLAMWLTDLLYRNWALVSIFCTMTVLIVVPVLILRKYVVISRNIMDDTPPPLPVRHSDYDRVDAERFLFHSFDGHALSGMMLPGDPTRGPRGLVIFAHEYSSDAESCPRYCRCLLDAGYDVMTFDFRGHGESSAEHGYKPRQWASDREQSDMLGAIAYAEDWLDTAGRPREIGLLGISRGGSAAILAAVAVPSVRAIVTDGAFSTDTTLEYVMKRWATIFAKVRFVAQNHPPVFWRFLRWLLIRNAQRTFGCRFPSVRKAIRRLDNQAVFIIHGERDGLIPASQSKLLYQQAHEPKYLWIVPGAKHNQAVAIQPTQYAQRVLRFFDRHLGGDDDAALAGDALSDVAQPMSATVELDIADIASPSRTRDKRRAPERSRVAK